MRVIETYSGPESVVNVPAHRTFRFLAERQAKERQPFACAAALCSSDDADEVVAGKELLEVTQIGLANERANKLRLEKRSVETTW